MQHPGVQRMLDTLARLNTNKKSRATREQVHDMVMQAFEVAKMAVDAGSMVRAAAELNKMNGYYAPEQLNLSVTMSLKEKQVALEQLSDEELLRLTQDNVIEGEAERVDQ